MKNNFLKKEAIWLWLYLRRSSAKPALEGESDTTHSGDSLPKVFSRLDEKKTKQIKKLLANYAEKSVEEQKIWRNEIASFIGTDRVFFDESLHWSHLADSLESETPGIRTIIYAGLSEDYRNHLKSRLAIDEDTLPKTHGKSPKILIENAVRTAFGRQFVSLRDLTAPTAFDKLNGAQTVRLIRLAGIREVAFACAGIEAVETLAAFLKRFPAEAARAIATQLNSLPKVSPMRLAFAEKLVQKAFEMEPQPTAMLDLLGIWLVGIRLCESSEKRVAYIQQKLPREFAPELSEVIENQCREANVEMRKTISAQIEQIAETILKTAKTDKKS